MSDSISDSIAQIVADVFRVDAGQLDEHSSPDSISGWDSLGHLELVTAIEREFDVRLNMREIQSMDTIANLRHILEARGVAVS